MGRVYHTESVHTIVLQQSISAKIRQLILYISNDGGRVDEFVRELSFAKRLVNRVCERRALAHLLSTREASPLAHLRLAQS